MLLSLWAFPQVGINTTTPQKTLHVNGSLQITNELNVGGNASTAGSAGIAGQVLKSNGSGQAPSWQKILQAPNSVGTLIAVNGQLFVAQEITVQLSADYNSGNSTTMIGNLTTEIIDNENKYIADATTNSFQVVADGTYQIIMNMQLSATKGNLPVIGVWDNQDNQWVARVNDTYSATNGTLQTYTLITSIDMLAGRNYSFRSSNTTNYTIRKGGSGAFPLSQISVKRVK
ncbi:hypothetical protein C1637_21055 [Chryseobacterium lactis]|nr:hypothetical protein EG341_07680 [Chryseobacterium lactis]PNW11601.1 hypothetical protein C1637_21055 [Chryseobacterium lactis]